MDRQQDFREGTRTHLLTASAMGLKRASQAILQGSSWAWSYSVFQVERGGRGADHAAEQTCFVFTAARTLQLPVCQKQTHANEIRTSMKENAQAKIPPRPLSKDSLKIWFLASTGLLQPGFSSVDVDDG